SRTNRTSVVGRNSPLSTRSSHQGSDDMPSEWAATASNHSRWFASTTACSRPRPAATPRSIARRRQSANCQTAPPRRLPPFAIERTAWCLKNEKAALPRRSSLPQWTVKWIVSGDQAGRETSLADLGIVLLPFASDAGKAEGAQLELVGEPAQDGR